MLVIENIIKKYKSSNAVIKDLSLEFGEHGLVSILGESGSGKSTLLNLIGLLDKVDEGDIYLNGIAYSRLRKKDIDSIHQHKIGFIYQNYNLIEHLRVVDNICLINKNKDIDELLEYLNIKKLKYRKVSALSGGEKQRVAIARSLTNDPDILLCDEPTGALDKENSEEVMRLLKKLSKDKLVIVVTHSASLAKKYSDRIITISDGEVVSDTSNYVELSSNVYKYKKAKISKLRLLNIVKNNLINKFKRNLLTILAISIGLISLSLVLGISSGFKDALDKEEKTSLSKYPLYISETSVNLDNELKDIFKTENKTVDKIRVINDNHKNKITKSYVNNLNVINNNLEYRINTYLVDNKIITTTSNTLKEIEIIKGEYPKSNNEVMLLLDSNNNINEFYLSSINKKKKEYNYDDLINYTYKVKNKKYTITCLARVEDNSILSDISGLIYKPDNFNKLLPKSIYLFPKSYEDKLIIKDELNKYKKVEYTDYSTSIKSISETLLKGISIVLISFSMISLLVSTIMIGVLSYISILERIKEIGILKSLGTSNKYIKRIFYLENISIGLLSSIISTITVYLISIPINNLLTRLTGMESILLINKEIFISITLISIFICLIGSYLPIRKTSKLNIIDCLKFEQ